MGRGLSTVDQIVAADLCAGCGACAALAPDAIEMRHAESGFARPQKIGAVSRSQDKMIGQICPGRAQSAPQPAEHQHGLWGPYTALSQGWTKDPELRHAGASGGALSQMLVWLLEAGKVDAVVQIAAHSDRPMANQIVLSQTRADVLRAAASRYAPSSPLAVVGQLLEAEGRFAFVGKPCDVAGLRRWAERDPRVAERFPVMVSFFCAGVPSLKGAENVAQHLGVAASDVARFQYRGGGWPGPTEVETKDGQIRSMAYRESWGELLSPHVQQRCRICADGLGLAADIAFADAWETDPQGYPLFDEQEGRSMILARTALGARLVDDATREGALHSEPLEIEALAAMQPGQLRRRTELLGRLAGRVLAGMPIPKYRNLGIWACARQAGLARTLLVMLGSARRVFLNRRWQS